MSWLQVPAAAMRAWRRRRGLISACRLGFRSSHVDVVVQGQGRQPAGLRKEVRTCEYTDVHVMWEMLSSKPSTSGKSAVAKAAGATRLRATTTTGRKRKPAFDVAAAEWSRLTFYCCGIV